MNSEFLFKGNTPTMYDSSFLWLIDCQTPEFSVYNPRGTIQKINVIRNFLNSVPWLCDVTCFYFNVLMLYLSLLLLDFNFPGDLG